MRAADLISTSIPPLKSTDTAEQALIWMDEFKLTQLPVLNRNSYIGIITDERILEGNKLNLPISSFNLIGVNTYVYPSYHFYDVIRIAAENRLEIIPVVDTLKLYDGVITIKNALNYFASTFSIQAVGSVLVLSMRYLDYSLSEISRLVEENNAKIICAHLESYETDSEKINVVIKINKKELKSIIATLERYNYHIAAHFEEDQITSDYNKDRLDLLFKYLDI